MGNTARADMAGLGSVGLKLSFYKVQETDQEILNRRGGGGDF